MQFDKSPDLFPVKHSSVYLSHCSVSPLHRHAFQRMCEVAKAQMLTGLGVASQYEPILDGLRHAAAEMLKTSDANLASVKNTSEGINLIAHGYPFEPRDQIISYVHEYPSNHYPWKLQENRGVELVLLGNVEPTGAAGDGSLPSGWSFDELERLATDRTRIIAISHVQFTSGFAADLEQLGAFCRDRNIDLVVDAAQSLGAVPLYPEQLGVAAVVSAGWKWLLGPLGTGVMYTSPEFRDKIGDTFVGAEMMVQGADYLNHTWNPHRTAKRFEYSTSPLASAAALETCIREVPLRYGLEAIYDEILRLQSLFLARIDRVQYTPQLYDARHRSPILSLRCRRAQAAAVCKQLSKQNVICTHRGGYLRFAPHMYNSDDEIERAADVMNSLKM